MSRVSSARLAFLVIVVAVVAPVIRAQEVSTPDPARSVFAPFVSRIRISTRDPEVRLTWQDSLDVEGSYKVYRGSEEITSENFLQTRLVGQVEAGVQSFIDTPEAPGDYFYAVIAETPSGEAYEIFIPYRNATANAVTVQNVATIEERSAQVQNIQAIAEAGAVLIDYDADQVGRELIVYRATRPFTTAADLSSAGIVATVMSTVESVVDYPVPGVPYYYGVVDSALVADGSASFRPGGNATASPVEIPLEQIAAVADTESVAEAAVVPAVEGTALASPDSEDTSASEEAVASAPPTPAESGGPAVTTVSQAPEADAVFTPTVSRRRPLPLPFLQLNTDLETGRILGDAQITIPASRPISTGTQTAVADMLARLPDRNGVTPEPQILSEDMLPSPSGSEYTLRTILDGPFSSLAWEDALLQLNNFLSLPLSGAIRSRALFYRAQCYYFTDNTQRAFVEFLLARDDYFAEVEGWLDVILNAASGA